MALDVLLRDKVTRCLDAQAEVLRQLEALQAEIDSLHIAEELERIKRKQINLQTRFTRLMYLGGDK